jgi:hypothetical protein
VKISIRRFCFPVFLGLCLVSLCLSCAAKKEMPPPVAEKPAPAAVKPTAPPPVAAEPDSPVVPDYYVHTVSFTGETLSIIAKWYTGDLRNWEKLAEYNPDLNPNRIFMGNKILIPRQLLIREEPLPAEFIEESRARAKRRGKNGEQPAAEPVSPNGVPLFGPRDYSR